MDREINIKSAQEHFDLICRNLDEHNCKYDKNPEELAVSLTVSGKSLPITLRFFIDAEHELITLYSIMSFEIPEEKRLEAAVAVGKINYMLTLGNLNLDINTGKIYFNINVSYRDSRLGSEVITNMLSSTLTVVSDFAEKFFMLSKGYLSLEKFFDN